LLSFLDFLVEDVSILVRTVLDILDGLDGLLDLDRDNAACFSKCFSKFLLSDIRGDEFNEDVGVEGLGQVLRDGTDLRVAL
jgi:hypothetical protein